ncbi:MAG: hypothetical protein AAGE18_17805 [Pseudomonadota bacterium]
MPDGLIEALIEVETGQSARQLLRRALGLFLALVAALAGAAYLVDAAWRAIAAALGPAIASLATGSALLAAALLLVFVHRPVRRQPAPAAPTRARSPEFDVLVAAFRSGEKVGRSARNWT